MKVKHITAYLATQQLKKLTSVLLRKSGVCISSRRKLWFVGCFWCYKTSYQAAVCLYSLTCYLQLILLWCVCHAHRSAAVIHSTCTPFKPPHRSWTEIRFVFTTSCKCQSCETECVYFRLQFVNQNLIVHLADINGECTKLINYITVQMLPHFLNSVRTEFIYNLPNLRVNLPSLSHITVIHQ